MPAFGLIVGVNAATKENPNAKPISRIIETASNFRQWSLKDYSKALKTCATDEVIGKFQVLDGAIWPDTNPKLGWSFFLNVSVVTVGCSKSDQPLIAFYNPWSDVFLVTVWEIQDGKPRMVDAEVMLGTYIRTRGQFPKDPIPAWVKSPMYKPAILGVSVAKSVKAFEDLFPPTYAGRWREKVPELADPEILANLNYDGVGLMLLYSVTNIDAYRHPRAGENPRLASIREVAGRGLLLASEGKMESLLAKANETLPDIRKALAKLPASEFKTMSVSACVVGDDSALVFYVPTFNAGYCMSFLIKGTGKEAAIRRVDVVAYEGIYKHLSETGELKSKT